MMLSEDIPGKGKNAKTTDGKRTLAAKYFNGISANTQTLLRNVTVRLRPKNAPPHNASGVILKVVQETAYVLTAKHVLYKLQGDAQPQANKKPDEYNPVAFGPQNQNSILIWYEPAALLGEPTKSAPVTGVNWLNNVIDPKTWNYDLVVLESTDAAFVTHAKQNNVIKTDQAKNDYETILREKKDGCIALNETLFDFFQLGYGVGKIPGVTEMGTYKEYDGKLQCKKSVPKARSTLAEAYEIDKDKPAKEWLKSEQIIQLFGNATATTAPGDSGGPLFCRPIKPDKDKTYLASMDNFFLVGVTSGADFFDDEKYTEPNAELPDVKEIHNNAVTFWVNVFTAI
jgi:hypothetical protein